LWTAAANGKPTLKGDTKLDKLLSEAVEAAFTLRRWWPDGSR